MGKATKGKSLGRKYGVPPAIAVALIALLPTVNEVYSMFTNGTSFGKADFQLEQRTLWERNHKCTATVKPIEVKNTYHASIEVTVCPSGDVLLKGTAGNPVKTTFRWVSWNTTVNNTGVLLSQAVADTHVEPMGVVNSQRVLCQRWLANGILKRRVAYANGCFDEVINVYSGVMLSSTPAPCRCF